MRAADARALLLAAAWLGAASAAHAETTASLSLDSDYRLRGLSLTDNQPAATLALGYDAPNGLYLGGQAIAARTSEGEVRRTGYIAYAGYAWRSRQGLSFDVGLDRQDVDFYLGRANRWRYTDAYVGVTRGGLSAHLYYSPDYLTRGSEVAYLSLDGAMEPADSWRIFAHAGLFEPVRKGRGAIGLRTRYDGRVGLARSFPHGEIRVSVVGATPDSPARPRLTRPALMVGFSIF